MAQGIGVRRTQYLLDDNLQLEDGAAAITADGQGQVDGADGILDLGGLDQANAPIVHGDVVVDISAITTNGATGETYNFVVEGSTAGTDAATFEAGTVEEVGRATFGASDEVPFSGSTNQDTDTGRYVIPCSNERNGRTYRYMRVYVDVAGTSPSITFKAWFVPRIG